MPIRPQSANFDLDRGAPRRQARGRGEGIDAGDRVLAVPADVTHAADLDRLMNEAQAKFGTLDGVFANAGVGMTGHCAGLILYPRLKERQ